MKSWPCRWEVQEKYCQSFNGNGTLERTERKYKGIKLRQFRQTDWENGCWMELAQDLAFGIYSSINKSKIIRSYKIRNTVLSNKFGIWYFHIMF